MLYLWLEADCPDKHITVYDKRRSPFDLLLYHGVKLSEEEFSRCYCYIRSTTLDLPDDPLIRTNLRKHSHPSYIFAPDELFYFDGCIGHKIQMTSKRIQELKVALSLENDDVDKEPKALSDQQLEIIYTFQECPKFSRRPILNVKITRSELQKRYDCIPNNSCIPIVNQKIVDLLLQLAPDDVQFFDAEIHCKDGVLMGYKLLNLTSKIKGLDHEQSIYTTMEGLPNVISRFKKVVYKPNCMGHHKLARDEECLNHELVTWEIKQAFNEAKITGVKFYEPNEFYQKL